MVGSSILHGLIDLSQEASLEFGDNIYEPVDLQVAVDARTAGLLDCGLRARDVVVLKIELSDDYVLTLLAALSLNLVVVPTDARNPQAFTESIVQASRASAVIGPLGAIQEQIHGGRLGFDSPELQYILFTSGSTGKPKGVLGAREGLINRIRWGCKEHYGGSLERCAIRSNPAFHDSLTEILCAVAAGRRLIVAPTSAQLDIGRLARFAHESSIDQLTITPSTIPVLAHTAETWPLTHIQRWIFSGEHLRADWCAKAREFSPSAEIINSYGSTEVTGDVAYFKLAPEEEVPDSLPIGRVAPEVSWELDGDRRDQNACSVGELLVGGPQVALGYLDAPEESGFFTRASETSLGDTRWFRTGDRVEVREGQLHYLGRPDDMAKVRGHRIDLSGVAAALEAELEAAEVTAWVEEDGDVASLVAAVGGFAEPASTVEALLARLRKRLPLHMIPDRLVLLEGLPRTESGKVDRLALQASRPMHPRPRDEHFATGLEYAVAVELAEVLGHAELGAGTTLSDVGLDSLRSVIAAERLSEIFACRFDGIALKTLNNVASIAAAVLRLQGRGGARAWREVRRAQDPKLVMIHPAIGTGLGYFPLISRLPPESSVALVEQTPEATQILIAEGMDGLASHYAALILEESNSSKVQLVGFSFGGAMLPAVATEIIRGGGALEPLVLIDPRIPTLRHQELEDWALRRILSDSGYVEHLPNDALTLDNALDITERFPGNLQGVTRNQVEHWANSLQANNENLIGYEPPSYTGPAIIIASRAGDEIVGSLNWAGSSLPQATTTWMGCSHFELLRPPNISEIATLIANSTCRCSGSGIEVLDHDT